MWEVHLAKLTSAALAFFWSLKSWRLSTMAALHRWALLLACSPACPPRLLLWQTGLRLNTTSSQRYVWPPHITRCPFPWLRLYNNTLLAFFVVFIANCFMIYELSGGKNHFCFLFHLCTWSVTGAPVVILL